jgi:hypothetical protein
MTIKPAPQKILKRNPNIDEEDRLKQENVRKDKSHSLIK